MIIYRITGKCERFKNCGMLLADPHADTSKAKILKKAKAASAKADKHGMKHTLKVYKLTLKPLDTATAVLMMGPSGCVEDLIESSDIIAVFASEDKPEAQLMPKAAPKNTDDDLPMP